MIVTRCLQVTFGNICSSVRYHTLIKLILSPTNRRSDRAGESVLGDIPPMFCARMSEEVEGVACYNGVLVQHELALILGVVTV
jgi:hypothetical protein